MEVTVGDPKLNPLLFCGFDDEMLFVDLLPKILDFAGVFSLLPKILVFTGVFSLLPKILDFAGACSELFVLFAKFWKIPPVELFELELF